MPIPAHTERRVAPRYDNQIQVDLVLSEDNVLPVEICGISLQGLQLTCDGWLADEIEPLGIQKLALSHKHLKIRTNLPIGDTSKKVTIDSAVSAIRRLSQDQFLLGLRFTTFEGESEDILQEYIDQLEEETHNIKA